MKSQPTEDKLLQSAREAFARATGRQTLEGKPEEGFYSTPQWAVMLGRGSEQTLKKTLDQLVTLDKAEKKSYSINGRATAHYRIK